MNSNAVPNTPGVCKRWCTTRSYRRLPASKTVYLAVLLVGLFALAVSAHGRVLSIPLAVPADWLQDDIQGYEVHLLEGEGEYRLELAAIGESGKTTVWPMPFSRALNVKLAAYVDGGQIIAASEQPYSSRLHVAAYGFDRQSLYLVEEWVEDPMVEAVGRLQALLEEGRWQEAADVLETVMYPDFYGVDVVMTALPAVSAPERALSFEDPVVTALVRQALLIPFRPITPDDVEALTHLIINCGFVESLTGIDQLTALENLTVASYGVSDLAPLGGLDRLEELVVSSYSISDLAPLKGLTGLRSLDVHHSQVKDLTPLMHLPNLRELGLDTQAADYSPLGALHELRRLEIGYTELPDYEFLQAMPYLEELYLACYGLTDLAPLGHLGALVRLEIPYHGAASLEPLAGIAGLRQLDLGLTPIVQLGPLRAWDRLEQLVITLADPMDLAQLKDLTALQELVLEGSGLVDLGPLRDLQGLRDLRLAYNGIRDLSPLRELTALEVLDLTANEITDLEPLAGMMRLRELRLNHNQIDTLAPLIANPWFGRGTVIYVEHNRLEPDQHADIQQQIRTLERRGAVVIY